MTEEQIGIKIRNLRNMNGLTQEELASRTELTKGYISQLERGATMASISTLENIVKGLGTNLSDFFKEDKSLQVVFKKENYLKKEDENKNITTWLIATSQSKMIEPILVELMPNQKTSVDKPHEGEETGFVLEGDITIHHGNNVYVAGKGDSFIFPANKKHSISTVYGAKFLWISTPPSF